MEVVQDLAQPDVNLHSERERCALLVEARAAFFEQKSLFPFARALRSIADEIRSPPVGANERSKLL